jgi:simple sugar transport system permease protein
MNAESILLLAILAGTPLILAVIGELVVELSGMINIGLEGLMLTAAMLAVVVAKSSGSATAGFAAGVAAAAVMAALFGWLTIVRRADQIICGAAINFIGVGITGAAYSMSSSAFVSGVPKVPPVVIAGHAGPDVISLLAWTLVPFLAWFALHRTRFGLLLRACGEYPPAVRLHGSSVAAHRWAALAIEAFCCGIAGAYVSLVLSSGFAENMIAGRGFIALAIVTFGRWRSVGSIVGVALFSLSIALQYWLQAQSTGVQFHLLLALPYVVTLLVLVLFIRDVRAPQWLGKGD